VPKEIHAILTETLACFLPGRAKALSATLYCTKEMGGSCSTQGKKRKSCIVFVQVNLKKDRDYLEDLTVDGMVILISVA